jgi:tetratricopeptide (TPR) repeat protein
MASAAALVRAGCLDCLIEAVHQYDALRAVPAASAAATAAAARTATLVAIRERELGTEDTGALMHARELAASSPPLEASLSPLFDIVETLSPRSAGNSQLASDAQLDAAQRAYRNRDAWTASLRQRADDEPLEAYLWLGFNCTYAAPRSDDVDALLDAIPSWRDAPLLRFRAASCGGLKVPALEELLEQDPRFVEISYYLGLDAILGGALDKADEQLSRAYTWQPRWPVVTSALASVALTAEDFERAADFYGQTLSLVPDQADAWLGKVRALTYLGRYADALEATDRLLALQHWYVGDARYWRALNELQLDRLDGAWDDIQQADKLVSNADVPKLAGMIAMRRGDLILARERFELAHARNPADCDTDFDLGAVRSEQRAWEPAIDAFDAGVRCFAEARQRLEGEIASLRTSTMAPARRDRQIARREQQMAADARSVATSRFDLTVATFNLARYPEARENAAAVADDPQFADRIRELLSRIPAAR